MTRILITGAGGFIGRSLVARLDREGRAVRGLVHRHVPTGIESRLIDLGKPEAFDMALFNGIDSVVHLAGIAHRTGIDSRAYQHINVEGTARLAGAAARAGVRRFVFLSTAKVHGDESPAGEAFHESSPLRPPDAYSRSKLAAEEQLRAICDSTGMDYVILRSPLVYGPGVQANFRKLLRLVARGIPLPLAGVDNRRTLIYVENLCDLIMRVTDLPVCRDRIYVVGDRTLSTPDLLLAIGEAMQQPVRLFSLPSSLLTLAGLVSGQRGAIARLTGSMVLDDSRIRTDLSWHPPMDMATGLCRTVEDWRA